MITANHIEEARERIAKYTLNTPLIRSNWLTDECGGDVYLKLESEQYTGSFKVRGSLNKLMWLKEQPTNVFPVTASSGNHGLGFARALDLLGMDGRIFLPHNADSTKIKAIRGYDIDIEFYGTDTFETEQYVRNKAEKKGWCYVSPYNDPQIIAGQGTIAPEILQKIEKPNHILATVGGGGLISGIATYTKAQSPQTKIIGCQPKNSPEMSRSVQAGEYQEFKSKPTLSDGSAGGFEPDSITFEYCRKWVDSFILVTEVEIKQAIYGMISHHSKLIEGAAAVAVASILKKPQDFTGQTSVIVICGANISPQKLGKVLHSIQ